MPDCQNCGGTAFYESAGFFYCRVCETQCHDLLKTVNESDFASQYTNRASQHWNTQPTLDDEENTAENFAAPRGPGLSRAAGEPASLFVLSDIILRAQVQWLSENAGVSASFAETVRSIWFSYLTKAVPDVKDGIFNAVSGTRYSKSLRKSDWTELCNCEAADLSRTLQFWEVALPVGFDQDDSINDNSPQKKSTKGSSSQSRSSSSWNSEMRIMPERISLRKLLAILSLALFVCNESVLISDLLRWIRLLLLPCIDPSPAIPEDQLTTFYGLSSKSNQLAVSYNEIEWEMSRIILFLDITPALLPKTPIIRVIERFITDLNLPSTFVVIAAELAESVGFLEYTLESSAIKDHDCVRIPENLEAFAMSIIICSVKIVFGLDDLTENILTAQTRKIQARILDGTTLFDFGEWMHYIDLRRLALFKYTTLLEKRSVLAALEMISRNLIDDKRKLTWTRLESNKFQDENYEDLQRAFQDAIEPEVEPEFSYLQLPVTMQPFRAHGIALANHFPALGADFSRDSLAHLLINNSEEFSCEVNENCGSLLEKISNAQREAFNCADLTQDSNIRVQLKMIPQPDLIPSSSLQWLITICSEMIEQKPESLLGNFMFVENCLFSDCLSSHPKSLSRQKRFGLIKKEKA